MKKVPAIDMTRFTRIELKNWRNFAHADLALRDRVFIVGPNASGKSNLLDAFRFLHEVVAVGGGLQAAVQRRGGLASMRNINASKAAPVYVSATIEEKDGTVWRYALELIERKARTIVLRELVHRNNFLLLERPDAADQMDDELLSQTALEQVQGNKEFRRVAVVFSNVHYVHVDPREYRSLAGEHGGSIDRDSRGFMQRVAMTTPRLRNARLRKIADALAIAIPGFSAIEFRRDASGQPHLQIRSTNWKDEQLWHREDQQSDGTIRLIQLIWEILDGDDPLLLDEPELSLHPAITRSLIHLLSSLTDRSRRQLILSTHSSDLFSDPGIALEEVVLVTPGNSSSEAVAAADCTRLKSLYEGGLSLSEIIPAETAPDNTWALATLGSRR